MAELGTGAGAQLDRQIWLAVIDRAWRNHLQDLHEIVTSLDLAPTWHAYLTDFQAAVGQAFQDLLDAIARDVVGYFFHLKVEIEPSPHPDIQ